jgi:AraC family transcriptional regulator of adaptative response/methylated-DNA-[protein]-cysteine methyltransferase
MCGFLMPGGKPNKLDFARVNAVLPNYPNQGLELPLDIQGTAFQRRVWLALQDIPSGSTASYAEIAVRIGNPNAKNLMTLCR